MSRPEILSAHQYRADGRKPKELRDISFALGTHQQSDGSALVSHGLSSVLVTVNGPREAKSRRETVHDRAVLGVGVNIPQFSGGSTGRRGRADKRLLEFTSNIKSTFEPIIQTNLYPRSQIDIFVQVLQQDGGLLQTSINATTLALIDAGIAMTDYVCAMSCALHDTVPLLDLSATEESDLPNLTAAVLPRSGKATLLTLETRLHVDRFEEMFKMVVEAGKVVHAEMIRAVNSRTERLMKAMGGDQGGALSSTRAGEKDLEMELDLNTA